MRIILLWPVDTLIETGEEVIGVMDGDYPPDLFLAELFSGIFGLVVTLNLRVEPYQLVALWICGAIVRFLSLYILDRAGQPRVRMQFMLVLYGWSRRVMMLMTGLFIGGMLTIMNSVMGIVFVAIGMIGIIRKGDKMQSQMKKQAESPMNRLFGFLTVIILVIVGLFYDPQLFTLLQYFTTILTLIFIIVALRRWKNKRRQQVWNLLFMVLAVIVLWVSPLIMHIL
ncbi:MAG: hypothetical protein ACOCXQ_00995 [Patescibacteria group bacterium]